MDGFTVRKMRRLYLALFVLALAMGVLLFWMVPVVSSIASTAALIVCLRLRRLGRRFEGLAPFRPRGWAVWVCVGMVAVSLYLSLLQMAAVMMYLAFLIPDLFESVIRLMYLLYPMGWNMAFWTGLSFAGGIGSALLAVAAYRAAARLKLMTAKDVVTEMPWEL